MRLLNKRAREPTRAIVTGRVSDCGASAGYVSPHRSKQGNLLRRLRMTVDAADAIALLAREHPDMSMAVGNLVYLSNQGHDIAFSGLDGERLAAAEAEWRTFCQRVYADSAAGLDGLVDALHKSSYLRSGMAFEVVVQEDGCDIEDVYLIDPMTIHWKLEERAGRMQYVPYQYAQGKEIDLSQGNFYWIPFDPDVGSPAGNLMMQSAIMAIDHQMELYQNLNTVLYRIGTPRYDVTINAERLLQGAPHDVRNDPAKQREFINRAVSEVQQSFRDISVDNDFCHTDDIVIAAVGGGASMNGVDARSFKEIADVEVLNATHMLGVLMNRYDSKTNALSSTEFKIMVNKIDARRRDSKRAIEAVANLWLRVHGYQATATFTHRPIEWETLIDKYTALLKKLELYRRADEYGYISPDEAASSAVGAAAAQPNAGENFKFFEYVKKKFSLEDETGNEDNAPEKADGKDDE